MHNDRLKCGAWWVCLVVMTAAPAVAQRVDTAKVYGLEEVVVTGKSPVQQINESPYNAVAIDARALHNTGLDVAHALDRVSGTKIVETGGLGSAMHVSLNGFSGRHVKVFMDGVPMDGSGSAFQMSNMPINLAERIEVYKGVVPIEFGSDALGGAINIVTRQTRRTYVDASYAYGSFNTHKSNVNVGHTSAGGWLAQLVAYQNYSDNSYRIKSPLLDLEASTYSAEEYWFKRFHDTYHNEAVIARLGAVHKPWANRLLLSLTLSREKADIQNANLMKIVYGGRERQAQSLIPSLNYEKTNLLLKGLHFSLTANYNKVKNNNIDSLARTYNWKGEYRDKKTKGEGVYSLSEFNEESAYATANLNYRLGRSHRLALNNVYNTFRRKATDAAANAENSTAATFMERTNRKNVTGLSYKFEPNEQWNLSAFGKYYYTSVQGPMDVSTTTTAVYEEREKSFRTSGYGWAATYRWSGFQFKTSFERAYRLPSERELFGDESLETGDASLKPEHSRNVNLNVSYNRTFDEHSLYLDAGFIYRDTRDYIRRQIEQRYGGAFYTNHGKVRNMGVDFEARYFYKRSLSIGGNLTSQNLRNMERYDANGIKEAITYKDRMPNMPYLFGNADANYHFRPSLGKDDRLSLGYNLRYIHSFFRTWQSEGSKLIIPGQMSHDVNIAYALCNGRYNVALEVRNLTDEMLFDNYNLQKPGRSFLVKLRYFFANN